MRYFGLFSFCVIQACTLLPTEPQRGTPPSITPPSPSTSISTQSIGFSKEVQPIFTSKCIQCHSGGGSGLPSSMELTEKSSFNAIVNAKSVQKPELTRVTPSNSANSLIYLKVSSDTPPVGSRMPLGGPALSEAEIATLKAWIDQGAQNN